MHYRYLGNSGLKVSEISLGSWITCNDYNDYELSEKIIDKSYELGINFFDTSNAYHNGNAEKILGKALSKYRRETLVIATKVFWPTGEASNESGLSRKNILEQVAKSLKRLQTDYIDLYYCHWYDSNTPIEETFRTMDDLVRKGLVLYLGVSNWTAAQIAYGLKIIERYNLHKIIANQPSYNMLDRYIENETIPLCTREGIGQVVYSPLAQGVLTGKYLPGRKYPEGSRAVNPLAAGEVSIYDYLTDPILKCVERLKPIAEELEMSLAELSLAWVLRQPNIASAIIGASRPEQIEINVKASSIKLSEQTLIKIKGILAESKYILKHNVVPW